MRILRLLVSVPILVMAPLNASAQVVATSFKELQILVKPGETIEVTDPSGRRTRGRLGQLSASSLELLVRKTGPDGRETFPQARLSEPDVQQIRLERRDSLWNGTLIGLAVSALPGAFLVAYGAQGAREGYSTGAEIVGSGIVLFGVGAGIGALVDASIIERTMIYYHVPKQRSGGVDVSPFVSKSPAGIQVSMGF